MIRMLEGTILRHDASHITLITSGGVGYAVAVCTHDTILDHESTRLYTHLAVRETALDLYGFTTPELLTFFELLLTIPKIGPKSALQILDQATITLITEAVKLGDATHLSKLSGIGKKTAEKIVMSLKDKLEHLPLPSTIADTKNPYYQDAFDTLVTLGYTPSDVRSALDNTTEATSTSDLVTRALKDLS
ncbi:MAG: Holliday junction branch migration protein RuvA [Candidatus Paceibacteria bacterium]